MTSAEVDFLRMIHPDQSLANSLKLLLACAERPNDNRLNSHLTEADVAETIRLVIAELEARAAKAAA